MEYDVFFKRLTGNNPYPWQSDLVRQECCSRFIRVPTGLGKTQGVLCAWLWLMQNKTFPRRLIWCLPMRVLAQQTFKEARRLAVNIKDSANVDVDVRLLMGGEDSTLHGLGPDNPAIIIGTQDMLLSRALNRGYAASRSRWPVDFGLLNHDALWIMDEVQLMDVGLATSAQLQAYRDKDAKRGFKPCHTWWMSATLQPEWIRSADTEDRMKNWKNNPVSVDISATAAGAVMATKSLELKSIQIKDFDSEMAELVWHNHRQLPPQEWGRITLVVCNQVNRACQVYQKLKKIAANECNVHLIHSRFRPYERENWSGFLSRDACNSGADRIIVSTQVVEAGVDISAGCLLTELAPWPSLVQRFGRCSRYGGSGKTVVVNLNLDEKKALPYSNNELDAAWEALKTLDEVSIPKLENYESDLSDRAKAKLYPYDPDHLLLYREYAELFDTSADMSGADPDISRYIRCGKESDVLVFWREFPENSAPGDNMAPEKKELCPVPIAEFKKWKPSHAWMYDWLDGEWSEIRDFRRVIPGKRICVDCNKTGGYNVITGFTGKPGKVMPVPIKEADNPSSHNGDEDHDNETPSEAEWKTIGMHGREAREQVRGMADTLEIPGRITELLELAALLHDIGKAHPAFQACIVGKEESGLTRPDRQDLAKAPREAWVAKNKLYTITRSQEHSPESTDDKRNGFRHELASMLGLFAWLRQLDPAHQALLGPWKELLTALGQETPTGGRSAESAIEQQLLSLTAEEFNILAYIVLSHHGKVRMALHATPKDQEYKPPLIGKRNSDENDNTEMPICGVLENDTLPRILFEDDIVTPELTLTLEPAKLGMSKISGSSWRERTGKLLERFGPGALAWLETIIRTADVRASQSIRPDSQLNKEAE